MHPPLSTGGPASILMDARTLAPGMGGVGRYTLNLLQALAAHPGGRPALRALVRPAVLDIARRDPNLAGVEWVPAPWSHESHPAGDLWLRWGARRLVRPGEVYHGPAFLVPGGRQPFGRVATIHDLFVFTHPAAYPLGFRLWLRRTIRQAARWSDALIVPSTAIAEQLAALRLAPRERITVVHEAPDATGALWDAPGPPPTPVTPETDNRPYLLTVGTLDPRKDPATARRALLALHEAGIAVRWLWAGGSGSRPDPTAPALVEAGRAAGFQALGQCGREALQALYAGAAAVVTCSQAEGFGLPVAEALAAGRPIVASDLPVHREIAGSAALYYPQGDAPALAATLTRLLGDPALQAHLACRAGERAPLFDWRQAAAQTLTVYRRIAERQG